APRATHPLPLHDALPIFTSIGDGETAVGYYIGYDRETNAQAPIYLTLLQSTVEDAIALGARRLSLGRTALEPKAKMGCKPEPLRSEEHTSELQSLRHLVC